MSMAETPGWIVVLLLMSIFVSLMYISNKLDALRGDLHRYFAPKPEGDFRGAPSEEARAEVRKMVEAMAEEVKRAMRPRP